MLIGPPGCGKTHLLAAFAMVHGAVIVKAGDLRIDEIPHLVEAAPLILVDDFTSQCAQDAVFHLYNLAEQHSVGLVVASEHPASRLDLYLADLDSRLKALPHVEIGPPEDDLLAVVMAKQFFDRQVSVTPEVLTYLVGRIERSFDAARRVVEALDHASLSQGRAVTIPLARQVIG